MANVEGISCNNVWRKMVEYYSGGSDKSIERLCHPNYIRMAPSPSPSPPPSCCTGEDNREIIVRDHKFWHVYWICNKCYVFSSLRPGQFRAMWRTRIARNRLLLFAFSVLTRDRLNSRNTCFSILVCLTLIQVDELNNRHEKLIERVTMEIFLNSCNYVSYHQILCYL